MGHTRSLLVFADDLLLRRPLVELERAASFAGLKPDRRRLLKALSLAIDDKEVEVGVDQVKFVVGGGL